MYFLMGLSLSADAFAVTISNLLIYKSDTKVRLCPLYFGFFQFFMTFLGYNISSFFSKEVESIGHSIVFVLLTFIGVKMICDAVFKKDEKISYKISHKQLVIEAFATSIDALAVGISLCFMQANIFLASSIIGTITFVVCFSAIAFFSKIPERISEKFEVLGGFILIFLGIKELF